MDASMIPGGKFTVGQGRNLGPAEAGGPALAPGAIGTTGDAVRGFRGFRRGDIGEVMG